ncbi:hypothetical protein C4D60_Mb11t21890 [Musa balbisiana]|uniref:Secreted protein n=1 Tax=Musa balbisiana TaxID=52838 RepID=A0A4S8J8B6_MUSBA|nr:hypothetical protein C4D60_Mb11t21890 [Musa balbisiana]
MHGPRKVSAETYLILPLLFGLRPALLIRISRCPGHETQTLHVNNGRSLHPNVQQQRAKRLQVQLVFPFCTLQLVVSQLYVLQTNSVQKHNFETPKRKFTKQTFYDHSFAS